MVHGEKVPRGPEDQDGLGSHARRQLDGSSLSPGSIGGVGPGYLMTQVDMAWKWKETGWHGSGQSFPLPSIAFAIHRPRHQQSVGDDVHCVNGRP